MRRDFYAHMNNIAVSDIIDLAGSSVYERGRRYFFEGRVQEIKVEDKKVFGKVQGSHWEPYKVVVSFDADEILAECSCPYEWGTCKHVVAVLLAWLRERVDEDNVEEMSTSALLRKIDRKEEEPSLLLEAFRNRFSWEVPRLRIGINSYGLLATKGIRIKISIFSQGRMQEVLNLGEILGGQYYFPNTGLPELSKFNPHQQHCLRLICAFLQEGYYPEMRLKPVQFSLLLNEIEGEGIELFDFKRKISLAVCKDKKIPLQCRLGLTKKGKLRVSMDLLDPDGREKKLEGFYFFEGRPIWFFDEIHSRFLPLDRNVTPELMLNFANRETIITRNQIPYFFTSLLPQVQAHGQIVYADERLKELRIEEVTPKIQLYLDYQRAKVWLDLKIVYPQAVFSYSDLSFPQPFYSVDENNTFHWCRRNRTVEKEVLRYLVETCKFAWDRAAYCLCLSEPDLIFEFLYTQLPELQKKYEIFYSTAFKKYHRPGIEFFPYINAYTEGLDWFHFDLQYRAKGTKEKFSHEEIRRQLLAGKRYIQLKSGECIPVARHLFETMDNLLNEFDLKNG